MYNQKLIDDVVRKLVDNTLIDRRTGEVLDPEVDYIRKFYINFIVDFIIYLVGWRGFML